MKLEMSGEFRLSAINAETGESRLLADWFPNLITDSGLDAIGECNPPIYMVTVGSGNTPPNISNTTLVSQVANTATSTSVAASPATSTPYHTTFEITWRFGMGAAAGNLSEVAVFGNPSKMFSRSLIKDSEGNPTTITVLANEFLDVSYRLNIFYPEGDTAAAVNLGGTTHNMTIRPAVVTNASTYPRNVAAAFYNSSGAAYVYRHPSSIGSETSGISGTPGSALAGVTNNDYVPGSHKTTGFLSVDLASANWAEGISAFDIPMHLFTGMSYQVGVSPPIPKLATQTLRINIEVSWARRA